MIRLRKGLRVSKLSSLMVLGDNLIIMLLAQTEFVILFLSIITPFYQSEIATLQQKIQNLHEELAEKTQKISTSEAQLIELSNKLKETVNALETAKIDLANADSDILEFQTFCDSQDNDIEEYMERLSDLQSQLDNFNNVVRPKFEAEIVEKDEKIEELAKSCQEAEAKIVEASYEAENANANASKETIEKLETEKLVSEKEISELKETIAAHLKSIVALKLEKQEEREELTDELQFVKEREVYLDSVVKNLNRRFFFFECGVPSCVCVANDNAPTLMVSVGLIFWLCGHNTCSGHKRKVVCAEGSAGKITRTFAIKKGPCLQNYSLFLLLP